MKKYFQDVAVYLFSSMSIGAWVFVSIIVTISGPFGTYSEMTFAERSFYWPSLVTVAFIIAYLVKVAVWRFVEPEKYLWATFLTVSTFTPLFTFFLWVFSDFISEGQIDEQFPFGLITLIVALIAVSTAMIRHIAGLDYLALRNQSVEDEPLPKPRLLERFPERADDCIQRLSVSDHFVEVFFESGAQERLRMRLSDAVREMEGVDGFLIHRSHWVKRHAIDKLTGKSGRYFVILKDGTELPVGRKNKHNLDYLTAENGTE